MGFADVLDELKRDFYFENRGMSEEESLFKALILSFSHEGIPFPLDTTQKPSPHG